MAASDPVFLEPGIWLVGELRSVKPGRRWSGRDGVERAPVEIRVLVGDEVFRVECRDEDAAATALDGAEPGAPITVAVGARAKGKDWLQWYARSIGS